MKHILSISNKSYNNRWCYVNKIVIAFLIFLLCIESPISVNCESSIEQIAAPEEANSNSNFVEKCEQRCNDHQNRTQFDLNDDNSDDGDTVCKSECTIKQCDIGCSLWENALDSSCQKVCNKSNTNDFDNRQIYCIKGCNDASNFYFEWIRQEVQSLAAPALIPDSLTSTSLSLEWSVPAKFSELAKGNLFKKTKNETYFVQCHEDYEDDFWKLCGEQTIYENSTIHMDNLHPYTKYKFRVALLLSENEAIYSDPSVVIKTFEGNHLPESEPKIIQSSAVDQTRILLRWEAGLRNNGRVLSYDLKIEDLSSSFIAFKEVPASNQTNYYIFEKLSPGRNYSIQISTRNSRGVGPAAEVKACTIDYLNDDNVTNEEPRLIIALENKVVSRVKDFLGASPITIYSSNSSKIAGISLDVAEQLLFVAEENGCIYQSSLNFTKINSNEEKKEVICQKSGLNFKPSILSVDWLNKQLYILGEMITNSAHQSTKTWTISRCDYEGKNLIVAYGGLIKEPIHMEVDPYNGYLFWVISGNSITTDGLFKLDLGDISNGIKHELHPSALITGNRLGAFVVDHGLFQLNVPFQNENTIKKITLKGVIEDIRHNTQSPLLHSVKSLVKIKGLFFWTNGTEYRSEEYHNGINSYFHNSYSDFEKAEIIAMRLNASIAQPTPKPVNPPVDVQAMMGSNKAKISWKTPELIHEQGKGAFRRWKYILEVNGDFDKNYTGIIGNEFSVDGLKPDTLYSFKVAGYFSEGNCKGGWSQNFKAKTLKTADERQLIWASDEGLVKSDVIGENITILIEKGYLGDMTISDIAWFEDLIYIVANNTLKILNTTSNVLNNLDGVESVTSVAVDWISRRLFWSVPSQQLIMHSKLNGEMRKPLPIATKAYQIEIDAMHGNIYYYTTKNKIEARRLNGKNNGIVKKYFQVLPYSGKSVMGLTLDIENEKIYWIVKSHTGSSLFSANLMDAWDETKEPKEEKLSERNINGPLAHFSDRLVWRQNDASIVIADMNGKNLALYENEKLKGLTTVTVIDKSQHKYPFDGSVIVLPDPVLNTSVSIIGTFRIFNISWEPVKNVNHGEVFYEITIKSPKLPYDIVSEQTINVFQFPYTTLEPHTPLDIMIISYTSWGASDPIKANIFSPSGYPTVPKSPRAYTRHLYRPLQDNIEISASFRWSLPEHPNGNILGYKVRCIDLETNEMRNKTVLSSVLEYTATNLKKDASYSFDVQAYTEVGDGNTTIPVVIRTSHERPIPKILVSTAEDILEVDLDMQQSKFYVGLNRPVVALAYIAHEETLYFINENNELMMSNFNGNRTPLKLTSMSSTVQAMTIDWIERVLYWSQIDDNRGTIYCYNLNKAEAGNSHDASLRVKIVDREDVISDLVISPFDRKLFWIENHEKLQEESGIYYLDLDTNQIQMLFEEDEQCLNMTISEMSPNPRSLLLATSPINPQISDNEVNDDMVYEPLLIFEMGHELNRKFTAVDLVTKKCFDFGTIFKAEGTNLAKDSNKVYWINGEHVYGREDLTHNPISLPVLKPGHLLAFYQQYFPKTQCLMPINKSYRVAKNSGTDSTLTFDMPQPDLPPECSLKNIPIEYTIRYVKTEELENASMQEICQNYTGSCNIVKTFNRRETIKNLKPFTHYSIQVALTSIYNRESEIFYGYISDFLTDNGIPSQPRDVKAYPLSYNEIFVSWLKPEIQNAPRISYEIHWETENHEEKLTNRQQKIVNTSDSNNSTDTEDTIDKPITTIIKVLPKQNYKISVRAYSKNDTFSESENVFVLSYPEPKSIHLNSTSPTSMIIEWERPENMQSYAIQYTKQDVYNTVYSINQTISIEHENFFHIEGLEPKTKYNFSIIIKYVNSNRTYKWMPQYKIEFETLGDRPSVPDKPVIKKRQNNIYIEWNVSRDNGAAIDEYLLETLRIGSDQEKSPGKESKHKRSIDELNDVSNENHNDIEEEVTDIPSEVNEKIKEEWKEIHRGPHNHYIYTNNDIEFYIFRVKAHNSYGWSDFSLSSDPVNNMTFEGSGNLSRAEFNNFWITIITTLIGIIFFCLICLILAIYRNRRNNKYIEDGVPIPDYELSTLRDLPDNLLVNSRNILYNHFYGPFINPEIKHLPQIYQHQIIITDRCLGKGAFGEVWSGIVKHDDGNEELVAIKTLHKGANDIEKREFLQEAQLMSNFKHDHILRLIGVCLNQNECLLYIVMELMESGDLLSFLRNNRPTLNKPSSLKLVDLISVCVDVASGCRYLEEMHFVHRDIAARNCLVKTNNKLIVKLGDFGLARDIYKNDYYRKEGEGLLPVRWMSPESLVDGVFTSQSDIWAFGVLMWEVMTLGQQPYPARTNIEVLHYVRGGGRLPRPSCPDEIYQLITKCWNRIDHRPTFRYCLEVLTQLHDHYLYHYADVDVAFSTDISCKYLSSDDSSIMNEKVNAAVNSETSSENMQPLSIPKYLELAYDENDERNVENMCEAPPINYLDEQEEENNNINHTNNNDHIKDDGYEIPINFDTELDINANNELNSNLSKSRTLSNSSTISHKSEQNYDHHSTLNQQQQQPQTQNHHNHHHHHIALENCKRSSLILERDYPQKKILASGWV